MALDDVTDRLQRITRALEAAGIPYALVGGQAVALWVATRDAAAVRTTKDVDILMRREDLPRARAAAAAEMDYFEVVGVGMFLERSDPIRARVFTSCGLERRHGRNTRCRRRPWRSAKRWNRARWSCHWPAWCA